MSHPSSAEEHLALIENSLRKASSQKTGASNYYIIWGCTLAAYFVCQFLHAHFRVPATAILANISMYFFAVGGLLSFFQSKKDDRTETLVPLHEKVYTYAWIGASIGLAVLCIAFLSNFVQMICVGVSLVFGLVNFIIGGITRFKPLLIGGTISMLCCIFITHIPLQYQLLTAAFAVVANCLVPGIIMKSTNAHV